VLGGVRLSDLGPSVEVFQLLAVGIIGTFLPLLIIRLLSQSGETFPIEVKKVEPNDFMFVVFLTSYMFPLFGKIDYLNGNQIFCIAVAIIFIALYTSYVPAHPVLRILNFRFYRVETENGMVYTLIAKRDVLNPADLNQVKEISKTMLLEVR
jgi:hypothetical protein